MTSSFWFWLFRTLIRNNNFVDIQCNDAHTITHFLLKIIFQVRRIGAENVYIIFATTLASTWLSRIFVRFYRNFIGRCVPEDFFWRSFFKLDWLKSLVVPLSLTRLLRRDTVEFLWEFVVVLAILFRLSYNLST